MSVFIAALTVYFFFLFLFFFGFVLLTWHVHHYPVPCSENRPWFLCANKFVQKKKKKPNTHRRRRRWAQAKRKKKTKQTRRTRCRQGRRLMAVIIGRSGRPIKSETNRWPIRKKKGSTANPSGSTAVPLMAAITGGKISLNRQWTSTWWWGDPHQKNEKKKIKIKEKKSNGTKKWTVLFRC